MLAVGKLRQRAAALGNVPAEHDGSLARARRILERFNGHFVRLGIVQHQGLRQVHCHRPPEQRTGLRKFLPKPAPDQVPLVVAEQLGGAPVRTNDPLVVVEHDDRVADVIEQRLVGDRTELVDPQAQRKVGE